MRYDKLGDILFSRKYDHTGVIDVSNYIDDIDDEEQIKFIRRYNEKMRRNRINHFKRRRFIRNVVKTVFTIAGIIVVGFIALFIVMMLIGLRQGLI